MSTCRRLHEELGRLLDPGGSAPQARARPAL